MRTAALPLLHNSLSSYPLAKEISGSKKSMSGMQHRAELDPNFWDYEIFFVIFFSTQKQQTLRSRPDPARGGRVKLLFIKCFAYIFSCIFSYHSIRCYICFLGEYWSNGPYLAHDHLAKKWWGRETNQASFSFKDAINQDWLGLWSLELPQELSWTSNLRSPQLSFHRSLMAWDQALLPQEFPSMGQAVRFLAYHTEELEEVHVGIQSVFHPL